MLTKLEKAIQGGDPKEIKKAGIDYLRTHRDWYERYVIIYNWVWNVFSTAIIVLGAATAILAAIKQGSNGDAPYIDWALIILPALSTLLASILAQFRTRDLWQLREIGRIAAEELVASAHGIDESDPEIATQQVIEYRKRAHQLEREQNHEFFAGSAR